jgi:hypothetical protein
MSLINNNSLVNNNSLIYDDSSLDSPGTIFVWPKIEFAKKIKFKGKVIPINILDYFDYTKTQNFVSIDAFYFNPNKSMYPVTLAKYVNVKYKILSIINNKGKWYTKNSIDFLFIASQYSKEMNRILSMKKLDIPVSVNAIYSIYGPLKQFSSDQKSADLPMLPNPFTNYTQPDNQHDILRSLNPSPYSTDYSNCDCKTYPIFKRKPNLLFQV